MKFKDIKEGDTVYLKTTILFDWNKGTSFWLPYKVERTTPKQFIVDGDKYRKEDGGKVASRYNGKARKLGETLGYCEKSVTDQTEECKLFREKIDMFCYIRDTLKEIKVEIDNPKLAEIQGKVKEIENLLKEENGS